MKIKKLVIVALATTVFSAFSRTEQSPMSSTYQPNSNWETLKVGSETNYIPFEFTDERGLPIGFEIELLEEIGKVEKFNVEVFNRSRQTAVETLNEEKFAIWASAFSIRPKRTATMDLSDPILTVERNIYLLDNEANKDVNTLSDLLGKVFAASNGAGKATYEEIGKLTGSSDNVFLAPTFFYALRAVYRGDADAIIADDAIISYFSGVYPDHKLKSISMELDKINIGFAVRKGDKETLDKINNGLNKLKENGTYQKLLNKWFGVVSD